MLKRIRCNNFTSKSNLVTESGSTLVVLHLDSTLIVETCFAVCICSQILLVGGRLLQHIGHHTGQSWLLHLLGLSCVGALPVHILFILSGGTPTHCLHNNSPTDWGIWPLHNSPQLPCWLREAVVPTGCGWQVWSVGQASPLHRGTVQRQQRKYPYLQASPIGWVQYVRQSITVQTELC